MRNRPKVAKQANEEFDLLPVLVKWARIVFQVSALIFLISVAYLLYGVFSGVLRQQVDQRVLGNLVLMGRLMTVSGVLATVTFCFLTLDEIAYAVTAGLLGVGLMFGMPLLVAANLGGGSAQAAQIIHLWSRNAGLGILTVIGIRILLEIVNQIRMMGEARRTRAEIEAETGIKRVTKRPSMGIWSPCWGLPYCHDAVRESCPAYKARRACWRFGYGCNCDPSLIERLIRSGAMEGGRGGQHVDSRSRATHEAYVRSDLQADREVKSGERTIPCTKCPIYLDHQRQKFRIFNPIAVVAALAAVFVAYRPLTYLYTLVIQGASRAASRLTYGTRVDAGEWFDYLNTPTIRVFFFVIVVMLVLAYVLKFVEWVIFEKKL